MYYVVKNGDSYLKYGCAKKEWTTNIDEAYKFINKPISMLKYTPKGTEIVEIS